MHFKNIFLRTSRSRRHHHVVLFHVGNPEVRRLACSMSTSFLPHLFHSCRRRVTANYPLCDASLRFLLLSARCFSLCSRHQQCLRRYTVWELSSKSRRKRLLHWRAGWPSWRRYEKFTHWQAARVHSVHHFSTLAARAHWNESNSLVTLVQMSVTKCNVS